MLTSVSPMVHGVAQQPVANDGQPPMMSKFAAAKAGIATRYTGLNPAAAAAAAVPSSASSSDVTPGASSSVPMDLTGDYPVSSSSSSNAGALPFLACFSLFGKLPCGRFSTLTSQ